ncbi:hypothetical protein ACM41_18285 [Bradyrhizobium sp. CCBAU 21362]|uniref:hypothetical protein n=1 Tax=Bradyrhizobium sp. CCBAU 21362 TaxID=1325082 RepID=UPI002305DFE5|nr:hypothetical protein [Bradyrhizobium sp. CCBAU 21362]MDA9538072.1 hypothetical protein [Bradyrhizobium sp. CCBAU 21362]
MDMKEASAMTEASGLVDGNSEEKATAARLNAEAQAERGSRARPPQELTSRLVDQLRQATVEAPLRSLLAAFMLGVWVARRR